MWPLYLAAGGLGIAFLITLLVLAWDNALETEVQRFGFESLSVDDTVRANANSAHDALDNLTRVFGVVPDLSEQQFMRLANQVSSQFSFVTAIGRYQQSSDNSYTLLFAKDRADKPTLPQTVDLNAAGGYGTVFSSAEVAPGAVPSEKLSSGNGAGQYILAQAIPTADTSPAEDKPSDIVVMLITPNLLLENIAASADLGVQLFSEFRDSYWQENLTLLAKFLAPGRELRLVHRSAASPDPQLQCFVLITLSLAVL